MNYLAHAYLSFNDPEVLTGNIISDFVKGRRKFDLPPRILAGVDLHRAIDQFTDSHPASREAYSFFRPAYGLYSAAIVDVVYDHFLAVRLANEGGDRFLDFTLGTYENIERFTSAFPPAFQQLFPFMKQHNWLFNYQFKWGIRRSLEGLVFRAKYIDDSRQAFDIFENNYAELATLFDKFLPDVREFALNKFSDIH